MRRGMCEYVCDCCCSSSDSSASTSSTSSRSAEPVVVTGTTNTGQEEKPSQSYSYCVSLLEMVCKAAPEMVHVQDNSSSDSGVTPIDIIQDCKAATAPDSEEYKKLHNLYKILNYTSMLVYRKSKLFWEATQSAAACAAGYKMENDDNRSCLPSCCCEPPPKHTLQTQQSSMLSLKSNHSFPSVSASYQNDIIEGNK